MRGNQEKMLVEVGAIDRTEKMGEFRRGRRRDPDERGGEEKKEGRRKKNIREEGKK